MQRHCPSCSTAIPAQGKFCPRCGREVEGSHVRSATKATPLMEQWRRLSHTLTRKEVRKLLGEPLRVDLDPVAKTHADPQERWSYEYHSASQPDVRTRGEIVFSIPEGRLLHWMEPDWGVLG